MILIRHTKIIQNYGHLHIYTHLIFYHNHLNIKSKTNLKPSFTVTKFIRIGIADKNDNPPYFDKELYEAEVDENEDIQHTVLTVTAKDHDECEYYFLT